MKWLGLLILLCAASLSAQEAYKVGDEPADVEVQYWLNAPAYTRFSDLRGEVILFKKWGCD
jgi:hypothetical protein